MLIQHANPGVAFAAERLRAWQRLMVWRRGFTNLAKSYFSKFCSARSNYYTRGREKPSPSGTINQLATANLFARFPEFAV